MRVEIGCTRAHPRPPSTSHIRTARAQCDRPCTFLHVPRNADCRHSRACVRYHMHDARRAYVHRIRRAGHRRGHRRNHCGDRGGAGRGRNHDSLRGAALWRFKLLSRNLGAGAHRPRVRGGRGGPDSDHRGRWLWHGRPRVGGGLRPRHPARHRMARGRPRRAPQATFQRAERQRQDLHTVLRPQAAPMARHHPTGLRGGGAAHLEGPRHQCTRTHRAHGAREAS